MLVFVIKVYGGFKVLQFISLLDKFLIIGIMCVIAYIRNILNEHLACTAIYRFGWLPPSIPGFQARIVMHGCIDMGTQI